MMVVVVVVVVVVLARCLLSGLVALSTASSLANAFSYYCLFGAR
jgi:hypothetical protein